MLVFQYLADKGINSPPSQVNTSPEILLSCRAHLVMAVHKISAADMLCKSAKKFLKVECIVKIRATKHVHDDSAPSSSAVFTSALQQSARARH
jgi:hypothetical protein